MDFIDIATQEIFVGNPFENNPHLKFIEPYKSIYNRDKSKDKKTASNEMYGVFVMCSVDETVNKWSKLSEDKRKEIVSENFKIKWDDKLIKEAISDYPAKCMTLAERTLKGIRDKLTERDKFLKDSPYTTDIYARDKDGNYISKGNTFLVDKLSPEKIDAMLKTTASLYNELASAEKLFNVEKDNLRIRGGRQRTDFEDGTLFQDYERKK